ncbi:hypothetical protein CSA56_05850 [candidate division KSB3 bacterium]|uniref:Uncharacterized protein n=1 Tax=candidate division KSB3 bacterium TaxID=2044937 RepID=A0A2G6KHZ8_9BACT|nr:MAG: hypothetical protein CSA56_05850 [candidate division KSB3 bacterium]
MDQGTTWIALWQRFKSSFPFAISLSTAAFYHEDTKIIQVFLGVLCVFVVNKNEHNNVVVRLKTLTNRTKGISV